MTRNAPSEILRRWPGPLIATLAAIAATGLGTAAPATATTTVTHTTASRASVTAAAAATQKHVYLRSALGNEPYVTTENGWSGSTGMHAKNVIRARAATPGPWEGYRIDYLGPSSGNAVHLWSDAAQAYVTAEFAWGTTSSGVDQRGTLHARPGQTGTGPWETFYLDQTGAHTFTLSVRDSGGKLWYVTAEQNYPGDEAGLLRARATKPGPWEQFTTGPGPQNLIGGDDYPAKWKSPAQDSFANVFGLNRECVSYVAWKIYENSGGTQVPGGRAAPSDWARYSVRVDPTSGSGAWSYAYNWGYAAASHHVTVNHTPTPGSVAWWDRKGVWAAHGTGHVAYVTAVQKSGSAVTGFDIAEYNIEGRDGAYSTIHFTVSNGKLVRRAANTTSSGPMAGVDLSWVPIPDGFVHINGF
ncbi:CHAP domain-containing protein [Streptomyces sp. NPDC091217]|uniref:CHAP domain-containing protein n=1 Tax=Streptomyces sp. NPDC091217 TaxID=3365975 RepID=UPI00382E1DC5